MELPPHIVPWEAPQVGILVIDVIEKKPPQLARCFLMRLRLPTRLTSLAYNSFLLCFRLCREAVKKLDIEKTELTSNRMKTADTDCNEFPMSLQVLSRAVSRDSVALLESVRASGNASRSAANATDRVISSRAIFLQCLHGDPVQLSFRIAL